MNKKFIIVSLNIFIISFISILGFKFILKDKIFFEDAVNFEQGEPIIKYVGIEEEENLYKIKVKIKNDTNYFASFDNITLQFRGYSDGNPIFNGYDNSEKEYILNLNSEDRYDYSYYFDPKSEKEYVFEIAKGLKFDKEVFDINKMTILYNIEYYKYKINNNFVIGNAFSSGGSKLIDNIIE